MPPYRTLVVDDFEPFRRLIRSALEGKPEFPVIDEATDGLEAIQKAEELQPDLILLDISLPKLDGIAAAREIYKVAPTSKILFFTQIPLPEIVEAALSTGASGYIIKSEIDELFEAMETVIQGQTFLSRSLRGRSYASARHFQGHRATHEVHFYSNETVFLDSLTNFITPILTSGNVVLVIATEPHRNGLNARCRVRGLDLNAALSKGQYVPIDVAEALSSFMVDDLPDRGRFLEVVGELVSRTTNSAKKQGSRISACGEIAPTLLGLGNAEAAVQVEQLWDEIVRGYELNTLCVYPQEAFEGNEGGNLLKKISAEHTAARFL